MESGVYGKPFAARRIEARARAAQLHVRVSVRVPQIHYHTSSQTEFGVVYELIRTPQGWTCGCPGYAYTGVCKHLGALERRAEREGWWFGTIAPLRRG